MIDLSFFRNKNVLITGHTGFKGAWMSRVLITAGANVTGYSLEPPTSPSIFELSNMASEMSSINGDICDLKKLQHVFYNTKPEIVIHMAAQPIVRESYRTPVHTYETNVMGTVNILECVRLSDSVKSFLNVTTDKVYENREWEWGYREIDPLDGFDPYSNSKSCSELVTHSYKNSFFTERDISISTARAGNVIGGGDFASDRIIPDCIRAIMQKESIVVRNPYSTRPYQHVLEPIVAYLMIVQKQYQDRKYAGWYNVGPDECDCVTTGELVGLFCDTWKEGATWINQSDGGPHEAGYLKLDCSKIKSVFGWKPIWHIDTAVEKTCEWTKAWLMNKTIADVMDRQIKQYLEGTS